MMTFTEYAKLVRDMRKAQSRWFRGDKSTEALNQARDYERRVDRATAEILAPPQSTLFPPDG
jgi:hypothetical protein